MMGLLVPQISPLIFPAGAAADMLGESENNRHTNKQSDLFKQTSFDLSLSQPGNY
jgi:hypothetical protein